MKLKIKTTFWEKINTTKIARLIWGLLGISITNTIAMAYYNKILMWINIIPTTTLFLITISHNKYESDQHFKNKEAKKR